MTDGIDTGSPAGPFFFHIMASLAGLGAARKLLETGTTPRVVAESLGVSSSTLYR